MTTIDPDASLRASLNRHRLFASGLLVLMAALTVIGYALPESIGARLLSDAAKAGFIGGVADWFAVTALFRHPLGLPIPHTAIVATRKERIGRILGTFVQSHFLSREVVAANLRAVRPPERA